MAITIKRLVLALLLGGILIACPDFRTFFVEHAGIWGFFP